MRGRITEAALQDVVPQFVVLAVMLLCRDSQASCLDLGITYIVEGFGSAEKTVRAVEQTTP